MKYAELTAYVVLIALSLAGFISFASVATTRSLTGLESVFLQIFSALIGFIGTFMIGRQSAKAMAKELIKPHARSAFRRLVSQYQSLYRMLTIIHESQISESKDECGAAMARLNEIGLTQINIADDALADWEDIIPEDVKDLRQKIKDLR